ncbi:MAG TPA: glycosyltransferase family A protein [Opitutaceae bacterium]|nr:glycosyltransferase family A protein [Opitutaceae bacterium]
MVLPRPASAGAILPVDVTPNTPAITVVSVVRNQARWIDGCAESVLTQEGPPLEWFVVDNASEDDTREHLKAWAARDGRVRVHFAGENLKQMNGLACALQFIQSPFIAILDGDDQALPHRLARSLDWLGGNTRRLAVYGNARFIDETGCMIAPWFIARDAGALRRMAEFTMPAIHSTSTWRADWLRANTLPMLLDIMVYDYFLLTRALEDGEVGWLPEALAAYRVHAASESQRYPKRQLAVGMAVSMAAARRRAGEPAKLEELTEWTREADARARSAADLYAAAAHRARAESLPRHALYYARRGVRRGQWNLLPLICRILWDARDGRHRLWPILRGGLLAAARVDGQGRSLPVA